MTAVGEGHIVLKTLERQQTIDAERSAVDFNRVRILGGKRTGA
jgi:hypothetical protein